MGTKKPKQIDNIMIVRGITIFLMIQNMICAIPFPIALMRAIIKGLR